MALTYPLSLATWFDTLTLTGITFDLSEALLHSETGNGEILASAHGAQLWGGDITIATNSHAKVEALAVLGRALRAAGASFLATPVHMPKPAGIPTMPVSPTISAQQNGREIKIAGLAPGDKIAAGEFIGWSYGSNPTRRALHQVVTGGTADGSGVTGWMEVVPPIRPTVANDTAVTLASPVCLARVVPGSWRSPDIRAVVAGGFSFSWTQSLR